MRALILFLSGAAVALSCVWLASCGADRLSGSQKHTFSSFDPPRGPAAVVRFDAGMLKLADADLEQVLNLYQEVSARTVIRGTNLPAVKISLHNQTPLTRVETLQLLDTALMQNGITMVLVGDATVKAVPNREAGSETPPAIDARADELPDSSSYMTCTVRLKHANADQVVRMLSLASRMPNSIVYVPSGNLLILRDYSANIRRMLHLLQQADRQPLPWEGSFSPATNPAGKRP
jgi:type II secretory pathway component GspD/PulD (secretin)